MHLTRLALTDFRSYAAADLALEPGVSTLIGANGQGKTNVVEAAGYVSTLGSHRVASDAPLVRRGGAGHPARRGDLRRAGQPGGDRDQPGPRQPGPAEPGAVPRPRQVLGVLRTVLFAPEDLSLVKGDPEQRRRYLDDLLVARAPRYAGVRGDYERVLRQRTALLKSLRGPGWVPPLRPVRPPGRDGPRRLATRGWGGAGRPGGRARRPRSTCGTSTWPRRAPNCWPAGQPHRRSGRW